MNAKIISLHALLVVLFALFVGGPALAQKGGAKESLLIQAATAWEDGDLPAAGELYGRAVKQGGLSPIDLLTAQVRMGTVYAAMRDESRALSAFRIASMIDPEFKLPSEAGRMAADLFKQARKDSEMYGGKIEIKIDLPTTSPKPNTKIFATATVTEAYVPMLNTIRITVQDPSVSTTTVKPWTQTKPAQSEVEFQIPAKVVTAEATLVVRVDAIDDDNNRWATDQARIRVQQGAPGASSLDEEVFGSDDSDQDEGKKSKGFWRSPWPWVIGGVIIVGAASTGLYFGLRPSGEPHVGTPEWVQPMQAK